jgi:hypothetical protein
VYLLIRIPVADGLPDGSEKPGEDMCAGFCAGLVAYSRY